MNDVKKTTQICQRCIIDISDPEVTFDQDGICCYCRKFENESIIATISAPEREKLFEQMASRLRQNGKRRLYDAIIGLSGGIDSSFLAYVAHRRMGLRLLAVHVDAGWNSELAVKNIETIVKSLGIDLYTYVIDWEEVKDLQIAFLHSGLANQDIPQDHAFIAALYRIAAEQGVPNILSGGNDATEFILPPAWGYNAIDLTHILAIHQRFGKIPLVTYPTINYFQYYFLYPFWHGLRVLRPLDLIDYTKAAAIATLEKELGWRNYGGKHHESRFTKFFQAFFLVEKFGFDKRRAHLASLVVSGQMSREEALREMQEPPYKREELEEDKEFIRKKLGISREQFEYFLALPTKTHSAYPSDEKAFRLISRMKKLLSTFCRG